ncbi:MAG: hypothetical protein RLZZ501_2309, partial [Pseudomonadota bacterium]
MVGRGEDKGKGSKGPRPLAGAGSARS